MALHTAGSKGCKGALDIILHAGAKVNHRSWSCQTPLDKAVVNGHEEIVETLLAAGGELGIRNKRQETPFEAAKDLRNSRDEDVTVRMLELLGNYGSRN